MGRWAWLAWLSMCGCLTRGAPMVQVLGKLTGAQTGWYRVTPLLDIDDDGAVLLPPAARVSDEDEDHTPYMERIERTHQRQYSPLGERPPCEGTATPATVYVLVHGIGGVGHEWVGVIPTLAKTQPAAMYMYKWFAYAERGSIVQGLLDGVHELARCWPDSPIVILAHSAGGVLSAFAASRFELHGRAAPVTILTVASPLAGIGARPDTDDADDHTQFFNDLGAVRRGYKAAAPGVTVVHLRTQYPGDRVMKPSRAGYEPNAISAAVKGAQVIELPDTLAHDSSLLYVAMQVAAGRLVAPVRPDAAALISKSVRP